MKKFYFTIFYLVCFITPLEIYSITNSFNDDFWEIPFVKRPEIILKSEYIDFPNGAFFLQGLLYSTTLSNKVKLGIASEYKYLKESQNPNKGQIVALRTRLNYSRKPQTNLFFDITARIDTNASFAMGISHSRGLWYSIAIIEGHLNDLETPESWINRYKSLSGKFWISLALTKKIHLAGYLVEKRYQSTSSGLHEKNINRLNIEQSLDFYLFGSPDIITSKFFDKYEDLIPRTFNRSLVLSVGNMLENTSGKNVSTQNLRILYSMPICVYYGIFSNFSWAKDLFQLTNNSSSYQGINIGAYTYFSKRLGIFISYNSYKQSGFNFKTSHNSYTISCNYNL